MKLFLCPAGFDNERLIPRFQDLFGRSLAPARVLFIPTALSTPKAREYSDLFIEDLRKIGVDEGNIIHLELDAPVEENLLSRADLVFVCPGDPVYLLERMRTTGFDRQLLSMLERGTPYIGLSAGADILAANLPDGLNLVDHTVECHAESGSPDGPVDDGAGTLYLGDDQALIVDGSRLEIVS